MITATALLVGFAAGVAWNRHLVRRERFRRELTELSRDFWKGKTNELSIELGICPSRWMEEPRA